MRYHRYQQEEVHKAWMVKTYKELRNLSHQESHELGDYLKNEKHLHDIKHKAFWLILGIMLFSTALLSVILWKYAGIIQKEVTNNHRLREEQIREKEESRKTLEESEARFKRLFMEMDQGALVQDEHNAIIMANPIAEKLFLHAPGGLIGRSALRTKWKVVDKDGIPLNPEEYPSIRALHTGEIVRNATIGMLPPGKQEYLWLLLNAFPEKDEHGKVIRTFSTFTDITKLKQSEIALQEQQNILEDILNTAKIGYWDINLSTGKEHFSAHFLKTLGYASDELQNVVQIWRSLIFEEDIPLLKNTLDKHIASKGTYPINIELRYKHKAGHIVWTHCTGKVIEWEEDGSPKRTIGCNIDITEAKQTALENNRVQEQISNLHKLESVGRLAGGIAHDLNNLLQLILGYSEIGLNTSPESKSSHSYLASIKDAASRAAELIQQLLGFARRQTIHPKRLSLNEAISKNIPLLYHLIGESIQLDWNPAPDLKEVKIDPTQLTQILTNLCINSRDAITGSGVITIRTQNLFLEKSPIPEIQAFIPGDYVCLTVKDNGIGIPKELIHRIFEPFFSTKPNSIGTGLGLPTVYGIVKQNRGIIEVVDLEGNGTAFHIYFPVTQESHEHPQPHLNFIKGDNAPTPRILLVDDDPHILKMIESVLSDHGYETISVSLVSDAIKLFDKNPDSVDLLISDIVMPESDGHSLVQYFHKTRPELPWLLISGYPLDPENQKTDHFLSKPFSPKVLLSKVALLLNQTKNHSVS